MENGVIKILIVDDDSIDYEIASYSIKKQGIENEIVWSRDGEAGLDVLRQADSAVRFLVLLDMRMPKMSGLEFLEELRADKLLKRTVVFALSSSSDQADLDQIYGLGISGYLVKTETPREAAGHAALIKNFLETVSFP